MNRFNLKIYNEFLDLSFLSERRRKILEKDPFFASHIPVSCCNPEKGKGAKSGDKPNRLKVLLENTDFLSLPFAIITEYASRLLAKESFMIHAACVSFGKNLIVLIGPSNTGKSSVAVSLAMQGMKLIGDDKVVLKYNFTPIHANSMVGLRNGVLAKEWAVYLNNSVLKSKFTNKFYIDSKVVQDVSMGQPENIFIFKIKTTKKSTLVEAQLEYEDVLVDLFKDILGSLYGTEGFSVLQEEVYKGINYNRLALSKMLQKIKQTLKSNKANIYSIEGSVENVAKTIFNNVQK